MPKLDTQMHLDMLRRYKEKYALLGDSMKVSEVPGVYGYEWGNPDNRPKLMHVRDHFVLPYINSTQCALEIGPGGGRWTKYLLGFKRLYCVDYHQEMLDELRVNYNEENIVFIKNNGTDFPEIEDKSIDFLFSYGTFVHLDIDLIESYLINMRRLLNSGSMVVIQYSDKTKELARKRKGFAQNTPELMRSVVLKAGYLVLEEDLETLPHSSVIRFKLDSKFDN